LIRFGGLFRRSGGWDADLVVTESGVLAAKKLADLAHGIVARFQFSYAGPQQSSFSDEPVDLLL
jgi:hypothetical protein